MLGTNTELYNADFYAWCLTTAALIQEGKWYDIDREALAEEIESVGRSQKRELESRVHVLVMHLRYAARLLLPAMSGRPRQSP